MADEAHTTSIHVDEEHGTNTMSSATPTSSSDTDSLDGFELWLCTRVGSDFPG